jgi:maltose-binding protein MalE
MPYVVLAPFYNPDASLEFATEAEAEAKAKEMLNANPNLEVRTAQLLKKYSASVRVTSAVIEDVAPAQTGDVGSA